MQSAGLNGATCVSINEVRLAIELGFAPERIIFNGNGKTPGELARAVDYGVIINVDSDFDFTHIEQAAREKDAKVKVLIRVNPDIDPIVHAHISTGLKSSKFGVVENDVIELATRIHKSSRMILAGLHCHLGSTIKQLEPIRNCAERLAALLTQIEHLLEVDTPVVNVGGGLGIAYGGPADLDSPYPSVDEYVACFGQLQAELIFEPGRSLVAASSALIGRVIGVKNGDCLVADVSMTECIRPALYDAYHHVRSVKEALPKVPFPKFSSLKLFILQRKELLFFT